MLTYCVTSSLEKCLPDSETTAFAPLKEISVLKNQKLSFQFIYREDESAMRYFLTPSIEGVCADAVTFRSVEYIPCSVPAYGGQSDEHYVTQKPGLLPDLLKPLGVDGVHVYLNMTRSLWIDIDAAALKIGENKITLRMADPKTGETVCEETLTVLCINAALPEQTLIHTEWFHTDSLATYYRVDVFSEEYWRIVENFMRAAYGMGVTMILTPVFTPPLDTKVGGERLTVQLVDVERKNGVYSFAFDKLDRFVAMAKRVGMRYFEIAHLFTQWGAEHAPKIMATTENGYERIFGWETDAGSSEYRAFLVAFLPALRAHLRELGIHDNCYFHISDEPNEYHLESYRIARNQVIDLLDGCTVIDALSRYKYYEEGLVVHPVPSVGHIQDFLANNVPDLWTYYCCYPGVDLTNRFMAMKSARTRYLGTQLYYYDIKGFLHWGFNFYFTMFATEPVNPFLDASGNGFAPSGDPFMVYPAPDGTAWESIRYNVFREGLEDMRAMQLAEQLCGRDAVKAELDKMIGGVVFERCLYEAEEMLAVREAIHRMILNKIDK